MIDLQLFSVHGWAQLELPRSPPSLALPLVCLTCLFPRVHLIWETNLLTTRSSCEQTFGAPPPFSSSSPSLSIIPFEVMSKRLLLSGINRCSPRKTKSAIDNCKEYTAATVSIGVSSTPLVLRDKETHSLEQYNFFWPICLLQTYDE